MNWGTELWDQYDNLSAHTLKGIDFLERYGHFLRDRCAIENEYAGKLRRLVKNYQPKKKDDEDYNFSSWRAFKLMLNEVSDLAGQREVVAENLMSQVVHEITLITKELREDRKRHLLDGQKMTQTLLTQLSALDRARKGYEKSFRESERALENFQKADADYNLSRAEVEKQKNNMTTKAHQCEDSKTEYANQLQKTNELQRTHFTTSLPEVFNRLQELDEKRVRGVREFLRNAAQAEMTVAPIIDKCLQGICNAADRINEKEDSALVIERYKSGFTPPGDFPFEDLSKQNGSGVGGNQINNQTLASTNPINPHPSLNHHTVHHTVKGTLGANKLKKRVGLFGIFSSNKEDFSDLPPNQQRKRLGARVQELQQRVAQETNSRDGLMKMKSVYEANPALGDPMTVEGQLNESEHKLEKLRIELKKYEGFLEAALNQQQGSSPQALRANGVKNYRNSNGSGDADEGSLSRSASDSSVAGGQNANNALATNANNNHGSSASPESGLGASHSSLPGPTSVEVDVVDTINNDETYYEADTLQPLGSCRALYPFEATSDGSIPMEEGEELQVMELDQGDGWTRVRRLGGPNGWEEGFVPTSYIESTLFA
ncbi:formin-binding protein 1-like isoform X4 [Ctenocephalides felis]|uniref:formin-binding protein 1-like isoform X4 n=1 Tax=Ctenocephalides felis TaxID=7515 RepID=UPI000E6E3352|nr:formin-binding protein 1-like isoform X4 [Ctenocephalides felis]